MIWHQEYNHWSPIFSAVVEELWVFGKKWKELNNSQLPQLVSETKLHRGILHEIWNIWEFLLEYVHTHEYEQIPLFFFFFSFSLFSFLFGDRNKMTGQTNGFKKMILDRGLEKEFYIPGRNTFFPLPQHCYDVNEARTAWILRKSQVPSYDAHRASQMQSGLLWLPAPQVLGRGRCWISLITVTEFGSRYTCWATGILTTSWALWLSIDFLWMSTSKSSNL